MGTLAIIRPDEEGGSDSESSDEDISSKQKTKIFKRIDELLDQEYETRDPGDNRNPGKRLKKRGKSQIDSNYKQKNKTALKFRLTKLNQSKGTSQPEEGPRGTAQGSTELDQRFQLPQSLPFSKQIESSKMVPFGSGEKRFTDFFSRIPPVDQ